jgi:hypothetical protein
MTRHFPLQCTPGNKNVSAAQQGWVVNLPTTRGRGGIVVLCGLLRKWSQSVARFEAMKVQGKSAVRGYFRRKAVGTLESDRQHVQPEPAAHDPEQQHRL